MDRLHRRDNVELCKAGRVVGMKHLHMLDTMTQMWEVIFGFIRAQLFISVKHFMIRSIPNRMDCETQPHLRGFAPVLEEFLAIHVEDAAVLAFADIGLEHCRRMRSEGTIHKYFNITNVQHVIYKTSTQTQFECLIKQFDWKIFKYAQF